MMLNMTNYKFGNDEAEITQQRPPVFLDPIH
ncbi:hypothetical protein NUACC26_023110 [Scytonema sp. NUACC26]